MNPDPNEDPGQPGEPEFQDREPLTHRSTEAPGSPWWITALKITAWIVGLSLLLLLLGVGLIFGTCMMR